MPEAAEHARTQRVQAGERKLHLRLDTGRPRDPASVARFRQVLQQRRLADSGLAAEDQNATLTGAHSRDEPTEHFALTVTVEKPRGWEAGGQHAHGGVSRRRGLSASARAGTVTAP